MLTFRFEYSVKPTTEYNFRYGIKNKTRPYFFNYSVGANNGGIYRFGYDRREEIYIEKKDIGYVLWPSDIEKEKEIKSFIKKLYKVISNKENQLEKLVKEEATNYYDDDFLEAIRQELYKNSFIDLRKNRIKKIDINKLIELEKTKLKYLDIYTDFLITRYKIKELIKENTTYILNCKFIKQINFEKESKDLDKPNKAIVNDSNSFILKRNKKALEKEIESLFNRNNIFNLEEEKTAIKLNSIPIEFLYEKSKSRLFLNLLKEVEKNKTIKLTSDFIKKLDIEKIEIDLTKEQKIEIIIKSIVLLTKLNNEIDSYKGDFSLFKILNEIYKHKNIMLTLFMMHDLKIENKYIKTELGINKEIERFIDKHFEKNFKKNLELEDTFKFVASKTKHAIDKENTYRLLEKVYEIIISIEEKMKRLDEKYIIEIYKEKDMQQFIKKLVVHDLITEEEFVQLKKSPIGKILLGKVVILNKLEEIREIEIDESVPMIKGYKEIMINEDIEAAKKAIEIDINKEKEFWKVLNEIEIENDKERIKFNKRFWFLRATDPFDWKILPYSDYPYREKPVIFDKDKELIPCNWQLEMTPKLNQGVYEHPIPFGDDLGTEEMAISIEIMIDIINIMILIWSRMYYNFSGYTGSQAVIRFTKLLYDWLILETSIEEMEKKGSKEHYFRCYRWIRWEAEKVAIKARNDMSLSGNMYISEWIFELIYYMENHHFDTMPIFDVIEKMDEFRTLIPENDPQGDIEFVLDKVKGMRHKIIECKANKNNE